MRHSPQSDGKCTSCGHLVGYWLPLDEKTDPHPLICPHCDKVEFLDDRKAGGLLEAEIANLRDDLRILMIGGDWKQYIRVMANTREMANDGMVLEGSIVQIGSTYFILGMIGLSETYLAINSLAKNAPFHPIGSHYDNAAYYQIITALYRRITLHFEVRNGFVKIQLRDGEVKYFRHISYDFYRDSLLAYGFHTDGDPLDEFAIASIKERESFFGNDEKSIMKWAPSLIPSFLYFHFPDDLSKRFSFEQIKIRYGAGEVTTLTDRLRIIVLDGIHTLMAIIHRYIQGKCASNINEYKDREKEFTAILHENELEDCFTELKNDYERAMRKDNPSYSITKDDAITIDSFRNRIICSVDHPHPYPIVVNADDEYYIGLTTTFYTCTILHDIVNRGLDNAYTSDKASKWQAKNVKVVLDSRRLGYYDYANPCHILEDIKNQKVDGFEIDLLVLHPTTLLVLELKSFHPHPLYFQRVARERRNQNYYMKFDEKFTKEIIPYFRRVFSLDGSSEKNLQISMYYSDASGQAGPVTIEIQRTYKPQFIAGILVNEIKEYPDNLDATTVVYSSDLGEFLDNEEEWLRWPMQI